MNLRHVTNADYEQALALTEALWDGRPRHERLSRLFFLQFAPVSFALETDGNLVGLLIGLLSHTRPDEAVVHFVAVDPAYRRQGLGRRMYERFFAAALLHHCRAVRAHLVPADREAIAFHLALGFEPLPGDTQVDGIPVWSDYTGRGGHRVILWRPVGPGIPVTPAALTRAG